MCLCLSACIALCETGKVSVLSACACVFLQLYITNENKPIQESPQLDARASISHELLTCLLC